MKFYSKAMSKFFLSLLCLVLFFSCSDDGPTPGCFQEEERRIVATVSNISGFIDFREPCGFLIDPEERLDENPTALLSPCDLDPELREVGLRVKFSGFIYESFEFEDICADFFEITNIEVLADSQ